MENFEINIDPEMHVFKIQGDCKNMLFDINFLNIPFTIFMKFCNNIISDEEF